MRCLEKEFISRKEASTYIGEKGISVSVSQLSKYATYGGGPLFYKFGKKKVLYKTCDIDEWIRQQLSKPLTCSARLLEVRYA